jgi:ATP-dependent Clp protease ATP-binding subunit ClpC
LKKAFAPEFLNRIDDIVIFESLERADIHKIIDIELRHLFDRIRKMGYKPQISDAAKDFILDRGWDEQFGARPLKRAIQKYIEDSLAEEIIKASLKEGDVIMVDHEKEATELSIRILSTAKAELPPVTGEQVV